MTEISKMKKLELKSTIDVYDSLEDLSDKDKSLLLQAKNSLEDAYAPYSNFKVGAAVLLENGKVILGNNQENAAYPLSLCAERVALFAATSVNPDVSISAIAITCKSQNHVLDRPATPCGSCRQAIVEKENLHDSPIKIILQGEKGPVYVVHSIKDLLPLSFDANFL